MSAVSNQVQYTCNTQAGCGSKATHLLQVRIESTQRELFCCKACFRLLHNLGIEVLQNRVFAYPEGENAIKFKSQSN